MEGHCYTCNRLTEWTMEKTGRTLLVIANVPRQITSIAQAEADTGGYRCAVCGERPYKKSAAPGRKHWPWDGAEESPFEELPPRPLQGKDMEIAKALQANPDLPLADIAALVGSYRVHVSEVAANIGLSRLRRHVS